MPKVVASGSFKDKEIQRINYCQRYHNATAIANVTLACGKQLDPHLYKGDRTLFSSVATQMKFINKNQAQPAGECGLRQWHCVPRNTI
eukprot:15102362-Ditylum_brightwellii.AAC.1